MSDTNKWHSGPPGTKRVAFYLDIDDYKELKSILYSRDITVSEFFRACMEDVIHPNTIGKKKEEDDSNSWSI